MPGAISRRQLLNANRFNKNSSRYMNRQTQVRNLSHDHFHCSHLLTFPLPTAPTMSRTKSSTTAPRNIDLDQHNGLVLAGHREHIRSERQAMIGKGQYLFIPIYIQCIINPL